MPRVGCQMIIFRDRTTEDFQGVLKDIHQAGYEAYEGRALLGAEEAREAKALAEENGLVCAGFHTNIATLQDDEKVEQIIAAMKVMGTRYLCNSGIFDRETVDGYRRTCGVLDAAGKRLKEEGLVFCYHNHAWEFEPLEGGQTRGMDILTAETDPEYVKLCVDIYWVAMGGEDPAAYIRNNLERCGYFHFKDGTREREFMPLGRGFVDMGATVEACKETGFEWIVVEQDRPVEDSCAEAKESRDYLKALGY